MADDDKEYLDLARQLNPNLTDKDIPNAVELLKKFKGPAAPKTFQIDPQIAADLSKRSGITINPEAVTLDELGAAGFIKAFSDTGAPIRNTGPSAADREKSAQSKMTLAQRMANGASPEFAALKERSAIAKASRDGTLAGSPLAETAVGAELLDRQKNMENAQRIQRGKLAQRLAHNPTFQAQLARRDAASAPTTKVVNGELLNADGSPLAYGRVFVGDVTVKNQAYLNALRNPEARANTILGAGSAIKRYLTPEEIEKERRAQEAQRAAGTVSKGITNILNGALKETLTGKLSSLLASNLQTRKLNTRQ